MHVSPSKLLTAMRVEILDALAAAGNDKLTIAATIAFDLLARRETAGADLVATRLARLRDLWREIEVLLGRALSAAERRHVEAITVAAGNAGGRALAAAEAALATLLSENEALIDAIIGELAPATRDALTLAVTRWELADIRDLAAPAGATTDGGEEVGITRETLRDYLRDGFGDPALEVTDFDPAPEGFGKRTILFGATSRRGGGGYVLRVDHGAEPLFARGCHVLGAEMRLVDRLHGLGFPVPEVIRSDPAPTTLGPGGAVGIVRRVAGTVGGDVLGNAAPMPERLSSDIAAFAARLHTLPRDDGLAEVSTTLNAALWQRSMRDVVTDSIRGWRDYCLSVPHIPSPALVTLHDWLLDHVEDIGDPPALLHGDLGLHNILIDDDRIAAVIDWEAAHLGDPAEDLAYLRKSLGPHVEWERFLAKYHAAGGPVIDDRRMRFADLMGQVRAATICNLATSGLASADALRLKLVIPSHAYMPFFLDAALAIVAGWDESEIAPGSASC